MHVIFTHINEKICRSTCLLGPVRLVGTPDELGSFNCQEVVCQVCHICDAFVMKAFSVFKHLVSKYLIYDH